MAGRRRLSSKQRRAAAPSQQTQPEPGRVLVCRNDTLVRVVDCEDDLVSLVLDYRQNEIGALFFVDDPQGATRKAARAIHKDLRGRQQVCHAVIGYNGACLESVSVRTPGAASELVCSAADRCTLFCVAGQHIDSDVLVNGVLHARTTAAPFVEIIVLSSALGWRMPARLCNALGVFRRMFARSVDALSDTPTGVEHAVGSAGTCVAACFSKTLPQSLVLVLSDQPSSVIQAAVGTCIGRCVDLESALQGDARDLVFCAASISDRPTLRSCAGGWAICGHGATLVFGQMVVVSSTDDEALEWLLTEVPLAALKLFVESPDEARERFVDFAKDRDAFGMNQPARAWHIGARFAGNAVAMAVIAALGLSSDVITDKDRMKQWGYSIVVCAPSGVRPPEICQMLLALLPARIQDRLRVHVREGFAPFGVSRVRSSTITVVPGSFDWDTIPRNGVDGMFFHCTVMVAETYELATKLPAARHVVLQDSTGGTACPQTAQLLTSAAAHAARHIDATKHAARVRGFFGMLCDASNHQQGVRGVVSYFYDMKTAGVSTFDGATPLAQLVIAIVGASIVFTGEHERRMQNTVMLVAGFYASSSASRESAGTAFASGITKETWEFFSSRAPTCCCVSQGGVLCDVPRAPVWADIADELAWFEAIGVGGATR